MRIPPWRSGAKRGSSVNIIFITQIVGDVTGRQFWARVVEALDVSIALIENAFERLANTHQIALAPGSYSIWMAHPFSGVPTNFIAAIGPKKYYGN